MKNSLTQLDVLHQAARQVILSARAKAYATINTEMVSAYWKLGMLIVEEEQNGKERAEYGKALMAGLSERLTDEFGGGYSLASLKNFRQFYLTYPISYAVRSELTWTHYRLLMRVQNEQARQFYEAETIREAWGTRALERQIHCFYYERLLSSSDRSGVEAEAAANTQALAPSPRDFIKSHYVLDFLELRPPYSLYEKDLEQSLIDNLQQFILELGRGFAFVARQKSIIAEGEEFSIDLVFYNYILKCFVLFDLKMGKLEHKDIGQMDMYVRMYEDKFKVEGDNPTIGVILCSEKNEAVVKYSVLSESKQLFASKYMLYLPSEAELKAELERERMMAELDLEQKLKVKSKK